MFKQNRASKDFSEKDLPSNRKEVFFDRNKNQFSVLIKIGLLMLLFSLPLIVSSFLKDASIWSSSQLGEFTNLDYYRLLITNSVINIPLYLIFSIGLAGSFRVIKNLAWEIPVFFKEDFIEGVKKNTKDFICVFFIFSFLVALTRTAMANDNLPELLRYIPAGILVGIIIPISLISLNIFNLYNAKFLEAFKLSLRFYFGQFFKTFFAYICIASPLFVMIISNLFIKHLALIAVIILILPEIIFGWFLYTCNLFDRFMNKNNYTEIFDKGIHRKDR